MATLIDALAMHEETPQKLRKREGQMTDSAAQDRQCQHVTKTPIYIKSIGGMAIDRSEWANENGAFFRDEEKPCQYIADAGERFCPRHKLEMESQS